MVWIKCWMEGHTTSAGWQKQHGDKDMRKQLEKPSSPRSEIFGRR